MGARLWPKETAFGFGPIKFFCIFSEASFFFGFLEFAEFCAMPIWGFHLEYSWHHKLIGMGWDASVTNTDSDDSDIDDFEFHIIR